MPKVCDIWDALNPEDQHNADNEFWTYALEMFLIFVLSARTEAHLLDYIFTGKAPRVSNTEDYTPKQAIYARSRKLSGVTILMMSIYAFATLGYFVSYALMLSMIMHISPSYRLRAEAILMILFMAILLDSVKRLALRERMRWYRRMVWFIANGAVAVFMTLDQHRCSWAYIPIWCSTGLIFLLSTIHLWRDWKQ